MRSENRLTHLIKVLSQIIVFPFMLLIKFYQAFISPMLGQNCRFHPSCSSYAKTALAEYGLIYGSWLALKRILKCHPFHPGGFDYVPKKNKLAPEKSCNCNIKHHK